MRFRKNLFFEIPEKDFIMPIYTEEDVNTLKSFLEEDKVLFSIGYKSQEDSDGYYYIGQIKEFTKLFCLKDFPLVYRKRVLDILRGLEENQQYIQLEDNFGVIKKIVYFKDTKNGPKAFVENYSETFLEKLERMEIQDYYVKEVPVFFTRGYQERDSFGMEEVFYQIKNPNY